MPRIAAFVVLLLLVAHAGFACTTEETLTTSLQAAAPDVQVEQRFDALHAQTFLALFTRATAADDPPFVERVVIYSKPGASTHKVTAFFAGCLLGHGYITRDTYRAILAQLRLAMSL
jgi:hypothetical protein